MGYDIPHDHSGPIPTGRLVIEPREKSLGVEDDRGLVWNGYESVPVARYLAQREGRESYSGHNLPPLVRHPSHKTQIDVGIEPAIVTELLRTLIKEDIYREGLTATPSRVVKAWREWTSGYNKNPADILKTFEDGAEGCDEMVVVSEIPFYSHCEHHLASIFGTATVAYIPDGCIVGLSKLPRLVDMYARRLQVQERMTNQIASAIDEFLKPRGCGVVVKARHMCMESRGIRQPGTITTTSALRGVFREAAVRAEFLNLTRKS